MAVGSNEWLGSAFKCVKYIALVILLPKRSTGGGAGQRAGALAALPPWRYANAQCRGEPRPRSEEHAILELVRGLALLLPSELGQGNTRLFSSVGHER